MSMNSDTELTLAFLDRAPEAAAAELQRLPLAEGAALLEAVPVRLSAPLMIKMIPWSAARLLEAIPPSRAAELLRQLGFLDAVSLVRLISRDIRERIIEGLPSKFGRRLTSALKYPSNQVGAWVDSEVPTLSIDDTARDALQMLQSAGLASHVFLESERRGEFFGVVSIREILKADPSTRLGQLRRSRVDPVSNRATLSSVAFDERWDDLIHLPVVGRRGNLLGGLARGALRQAIHEHYPVSKGQSASWLRELIAAYGVVTFGIVQMISRSVSISGVRVGGGRDE
jgi:magnesium transporter